jgi:hypothetical protein
MAAAATRWLSALMLRIQRERPMAIGENAWLAISLSQLGTFMQQSKAMAT